MKPILPIIAAALLVAACSAAAQGHPEAEARGDILIAAQFATAEMAAERGDPDMVMLSLKPAMRDDIFDQLSKPKQYQVAALYSTAARMLGRSGDAHLGAVRATASSQATPEDWDRRMHSAILIGDGPDAYLAFRRLARDGKQPLSTFGGRQLDRLDRLLGALPNGREARIALGREMEAEDWQGSSAYNDPSLIRLHYTEALLEQGDLKKANAVAGRITDPVVVMALRADRRFDMIAAGGPTLLDPQVAAQRYLEWAQAYVRDNPRALSGRIAVMRALTVLNRSGDALAYAENTSQLMAHGSRSHPAFDDLDEAAIFEGWKDAALTSAGRLDASVAGLTTAVSCHCSAYATVQLGRTLMEAARPKEAREWLRDADEDGLGLEDRITLAQTRACVAAQLGDEEGVAKEITFIKSREAWKPGAMVAALVCAGQLDTAAGILAKQLADPRSRLAALSSLQTYAVDPGDGPYAVTLRARWATLGAMPIVRAEVAKVGRLNSYALQARGAVA